MDLFSIYSCPKCSHRLDKLAVRSLWKKGIWKKIVKEHNSLLNYLLGHGPNVTWFFVFHKIQCGCGWHTCAIYRMRFLANPDIPVERKDFSLVDIVDASFNVQGLYTGRRIKGMIAAFLNRWNKLADLVIVCSPFIGSRYTSGEWEWLMKQLVPYFSYIITRPPSFGYRKKLPLFQKVLKEKDKEKRENEFVKIIATEPEEFEKTFIGPMLAEQNVIRRKKFHAKYYAGVFSDHAEIIHSSFNIYKKEEHQLENVAFEVCPVETFFQNYIKPFNIDKLQFLPDTRLEQTDTVGCAFCLEQEDEFEIKFLDYKIRAWGLINQFLVENKLLQA